MDGNLEPQNSWHTGVFLSRMHAYHPYVSDNNANNNRHNAVSGSPQPVIDGWSNWYPCQHLLAGHATLCATQLPLSMDHLIKPFHFVCTLLQS